MNITPLTIYLWQLADRIIIVSVPCIAIFLVAAFVAFGIGSDSENQTRKNLFRFGFCSLFSGLMSLVVYTLTPSSSTVAMMVVIPEIAHSKVIQQDLPDIYNAAVDALKNQLKK